MSYTGKCIYINLTDSKCEIRESDKNLQRDYIGAKGMGFALLNKLAPNPDPLGPENPLIFINGPFTGTKVQTSARTTLVTKSPLTNCAHDAHCGGSFGPRMKFSGYDYFVITGKATKPVYLYITPGKAEILDASIVWGKGIFETNDVLLAKHPGTDPHLAAIGPAGENMLKISCIGVDKHRQFGRGGVGAVMGSKNLKAVVVDGNEPLVYSDEAKFNEVNMKYTKEILSLDGIKYRRQKGTMKCIRGCQNTEILPTKNWSKVQYDDFEKISSETAREELNWEDTSCYNCSIRCSKWARWDGHEIEGPEYETAALFGSNCEVNSIKDISWANELCNDLGLDTISAGNVTGFAMECFEKKYLDNWDGMEMKWGNAEVQREFIKRMTYRKGVANIFADGTKLAAEKIGKGSKDIAINIFGMELSGINPLGSLTMGVAMSVADFASHTRLWIAESEMGPDFKIEDIPGAVVEGIDTTNVRNSMVICDFVPLNLDKLAEILNAITGSAHTGKSLLEIGTKITNLARVYNMRNGRKGADDTLPGRFFNEVSQGGFMKGRKLEKEYFNSIIQKYYSIRNWDSSGTPTSEILKKYDLV